jgi:predicted ATPase
MPIIQSITLKNFKGVETVAIDIAGRTPSPVITLIGLNESGKTTILEGLSYFISGDNAVSGLFDRLPTKNDISALIPLHRKAAFTDNIEIVAEVKLDANDAAAIQEVARKKGSFIEKTKLPQKLTITKRYQFEDSALTQTTNVWEGLIFKARPAKGTKEKEFNGPSGNPDHLNLWSEVAGSIAIRLPRIAYFPTFLVNMPAKIYLEEHDDEEPVNRYYRIVFQDILDSLGEGLSLEKHVCKRISDFKDREKSAVWFSSFFGGPSRAPVDSVFQKISSAVTKEVLGSWKRVFQRPISAKSISIEWSVDSSKNDLPYASFVVSDGESRYNLNERSLGFRWFFSFLLFTAFKQGVKRETIFVFDEPAANLHAKAQAELLTSFSKIVGSGNRIIYSTHSHHMINPRWLSGAYIVENTALDYDADDAFNLMAKPTNIRATPYRMFVSQYPSRTSYFQPVIEKLEYVTPEVVGNGPFVIVEGISDYYALRLAFDMRAKPPRFSLMPGCGSGASGPLLSLLLGRGESFLLLVDDDKAGRKEKVRYQSEWCLRPGQVLTVADLDPTLT